VLALVTWTTRDRSGYRAIWVLVFGQTLWTEHRSTGLICCLIPKVALLDYSRRGITQRAISSPEPDRKRHVRKIQSTKSRYVNTVRVVPR